MTTTAALRIGPCLLLPAAFIALHAADAGYRFAPGPAQSYLAETRQEVAWESAGDKLAFVSTLALSQAWKCVAVEGTIARVEVTTLRVIATHKGPGADHAFDSAVPESAEDPLLGHLKAIEGVTLVFAIDQATGATRVTGGSRIAEAIARRAPNLVDPLSPSPLAAQAAQLYGDANLSRIWSQTLALPSATAQEVPLGEPLTGVLTRTWKGFEYALAGTPAGMVTLAREPTPVTATISPVAGTGSAAIAADGWPQTAGGGMSFTLTVDALTQPVAQRHTVRWQLARLSAGGGTAASGSR